MLFTDTTCYSKRVNMMQLALIAVVFLPSFIQALVPHVNLPRRSPGGIVLSMSTGETNEVLSRREAIKRVVAVCGGGCAIWTSAVSGTSAKTPVMKLPDDEAARSAVSYEGNNVIPPFTTLPSGVQIVDIKVGSGPAADVGRGVTIQWVLRRRNGYYVSASSEGDGEPFIYRVGDPKRAITGFDDGIRGMQAGGTRRIVVPPKLAYVQGCKDGNPGPIPAGFGPQQQINRRPDEPLTFEVKMTKVR